MFRYWMFKNKINYRHQVIYMCKQLFDTVVLDRSEQYQFLIIHFQPFPIEEMTQQQDSTSTSYNRNPQSKNQENHQNTKQLNLIKKNSFSSLLHRSSTNSFTRSSINDIISTKKEASSQYKQSWTKFIHKSISKCSAGMDKKPLVPYNSNHQRSRLPVLLKVQKSRSNKKNTFQNFQMISNRTIIKNTFQSIYQKSFKHPQVLRALKLKQRMIQ